MPGSTCIAPAQVGSWDRYRSNGGKRCGNAIEQTGNRAKTTCSDACRKALSRERQAIAERERQNAEHRENARWEEISFQVPREVAAALRQSLGVGAAVRYDVAFAARIIDALAVCDAPARVTIPGQLELSA